MLELGDATGDLSPEGTRKLDQATDETQTKEWAPRTIRSIMCAVEGTIASLTKVLLPNKKPAVRCGRCWEVNVVVGLATGYLRRAVSWCVSSDWSMVGY